MQLNNKGITNGQMALAMGLLIFFLLYVAFTSHRVTEALKDMKAGKFGPDPFSDSLSSDDNFSTNYYPDLENKLKEAANIFIENYYEGQTSDTIIVDYTTLESFDLIKDFRDKEDKTLCDGYVNIQGNYREAFIKCNNYVTEGYNG